MKTIPAIIFVCSLLLIGCSTENKETTVNISFKNEMYVPYTPVRNQGSTQSCWAYTMSSLVESERLISHKDTVSLSVMYILRHKYLEHFYSHYYSKGKDIVRGGSLGHTYLSLYDKMGAIPDSIYRGIKGGVKRHDHKKLVKNLKLLANKAVKEKDLQKYVLKAENLLDETLGKIPATFIYKGQTYTPVSFADTLGFNPHNYIELTSFTHHPFYEWFVMEVPDNWEHEKFYNIPVVELEKITRDVLENGRSVAWDGDISEKGFNPREGVATFPASDVSQEMRQMEFDTFATTDDHMMHIIGTADGSDGKFYYILKNSWGKVGPYKGLLYMSEDYFRAKTISVVVPKEHINLQGNGPQLH